MGYFEYTDEMYKASLYTVEDEPKLMATIKSIVEIAFLARKEGLLGVECDIEKMDKDFYRTISQMVVDGTDVNLQFDYGLNLIREMRKDPAELRNMMIWNKGMALLSEGYHPYIINRVLESMIGKYSFEDAGWLSYDKSW